MRAVRHTGGGTAVVPRPEWCHVALVRVVTSESPCETSQVAACARCGADECLPEARYDAERALGRFFKRHARCPDRSAYPAPGPRADPRVGRVVFRRR